MLISFTHQVEFFLLMFFNILDLHLFNFWINKVLKPDLVSVFTVLLFYFYTFACSEIFQRNARELGVGHEPFHPGINGLNVFAASESFLLSLHSPPLNHKSEVKYSVSWNFICHHHIVYTRQYILPWKIFFRFVTS